MRSPSIRYDPFHPDFDCKLKQCIQFIFFTKAFDIYRDLVFAYIIDLHVNELTCTAAIETIAECIT